MPDFYRLIFRLAEIMRYDSVHAAQVASYSLQIFDQTWQVHRLSDHERTLLHVASILHDIGAVMGARDHHKRSFATIMEARQLPLDARSRVHVALVARYHRGKTPQSYHLPFQCLSSRDKASVLKLSAILRLADGMNRSHSPDRHCLTCEIESNTLTIVPRPLLASQDIEWGIRKSDLFSEVFSRKVVISS